MSLPDYLPFKLRLRPPYYPQWGDEKDRQGTSSASRRLFGEDRSGQIFSEILHRFRRTGSPHKGYQPYRLARAKVWRDMARRDGADAAEVRALEAYVDGLYMGASGGGRRRGRRETDGDR